MFTGQSEEGSSSTDTSSQVCQIGEQDYLSHMVYNTHNVCVQTVLKIQTHTDTGSHIIYIYKTQIHTFTYAHKSHTHIQTHADRNT